MALEQLVQGELELLVEGQVLQASGEVLVDGQPCNELDQLQELSAQILQPLVRLLDDQQLRHAIQLRELLERDGLRGLLLWLLHVFDHLEGGIEAEELLLLLDRLH